MALIRCGECGRDVSSWALTCPACGNPIAAQSAVLAVARIKERFAKQLGLELTKLRQIIACLILFWLSLNPVLGNIFVFVENTFTSWGFLAHFALTLLLGYGVYRFLRFGAPSVMRLLGEMASAKKMDSGVRLALGWLALAIPLIVIISLRFIVAFNGPFIR